MAAAELTVALIVLLSGPAVGSFLGVLVERLPRGQSLLAPSACAGCGARLGWRDMVPVISALALGGRCRACGAAIPGHLMRIEIAATLAGVLAVLLVPGPGPLLVTALLLWCLIALFYCDLLHGCLPDLLTGALLALGLVLAALDPGRGLGPGLASAGLGAGAFWLIRVAYRALRGQDGLGQGDVKLMAGIGAALGWMMIAPATLLAALMALAVAGIVALRDRTVPTGSTALPLGAYLAASAALFLLIGSISS